MVLEGGIYSQESIINDVFNENQHSLRVQLTNETELNKLTQLTGLTVYFDSMNSNLQRITQNLLLGNYVEYAATTEPTAENEQLYTLVTGTRINSIPYPHPILIFTGNSIGIIDFTDTTDIVFGQQMLYNDMIEDTWQSYTPGKLHHAMHLPHLIYFSGSSMQNITSISNSIYRDEIFKPRQFKQSNIHELRIPYWMNKMSYINLEKNSLSVLTIEHILTHLDINGIMRGEVHLYFNDNNRRLTANAQIAVTNLIMKGWKVRI